MWFYCNLWDIISSFVFKKERKRKEKEMILNFPLFFRNMNILLLFSSFVFRKERGKKENEMILPFPLFFRNMNFYCYFF